MAVGGGGSGLKRRLTSQEQELWRRIQRSVTPLPGRVEAQPEGWVELPPDSFPPARAEAPKSVASEVGLPAPPPASRPHAKAPADRGRERRVRRGKLNIAARLDLHGLSQDRAEQALRIFLHDSAEQGARVVLVVTGKGMRVDGDGERRPGILRQRLPDWLAQAALRSLVSGYAVAHASHGGEGAFYVFLRTKPDLAY